MTEAPFVSRHDIEGKLDELYSSERRHHLVAFFGTGVEEVVRLKKAGEFRVVPVRSELELRERLPALDKAEERVAYLVPWTHDMPLDISGRFARNGRVLRVGREARLARMFGVGDVESEVLACPLVDHLLRPANDRKYPLGEARLTIDALWARWLMIDWGLDTTGGLALDAMLAWAANDARGAAFREEMSGPLGSAVRGALSAHLNKHLGVAGPVLWAAWDRGGGRAVLEHAALFEAVAGSDAPAVRMWVKNKTREKLGVEADADAIETARALGRAAAGALRMLDPDRTGALPRQIARAADELIDDEEIREAVLDSPRLPSAWKKRLERLGGALQEIAATPTADGVGRASALLQGLESHVFFADPEQTRTVERAEMACRLGAWLVARPDRRIEPGSAAHGAVEALGRWYAEEGGFVDWARRAARAPADGKFGAGALAVVERADEVRAELDARFARGLLAWLEANKPSSRVLPIEEATKRVVGKFLEEREERKVLVLLVDGMAWAQAAELLESLGNRAAAWGPIAWHASKSGRIGEGYYPVMLAALPSVTEVSRSAFFAGKPMKSGKKLDTQKDPEQWAANATLAKYAKPVGPPDLMLRAESHTRAGVASEAALSLVGDASKRVVGVVLNAIDDSLKANPAERHPWDVESIASLPDLLQKARETGRAVLLVADHGHVRSDRFVSRAPATTGGARWRPWKAGDDTLADDEMRVPGTLAWAPAGSEGVVVLTSDAGTYGPSTHAGEHGGATLAEVVAPCVLVACEDLVGSGPDEDVALRARAPFVPRWWHFEVEVSQEVPEPVVSPAVELVPAPVPDQGQLTLPTVVAKEGAVAPAPKVTESAFARSAVLAARVSGAAQRQEIVRAVDLLLSKQGSMSAKTFAAEMQILAYRVSGFISKLQEVLNVDGYEVLRYEPKTQDVRLDVGKLEQLFEVVR